MARRFADRLARATEIIDDEMGEPSQITYMGEGGRTAFVVDQTKPPITPVGVFHVNPDVIVPQDQGQYDGYQPTLDGDKCHVLYRYGVFENGRDDWPNKNDIITQTDADGQPSYRVTRVHDDGIGRITCICVPAVLQQATP